MTGAELGLLSDASTYDQISFTIYLIFKLVTSYEILQFSHNACPIKKGKVYPFEAQKRTLRIGTILHVTANSLTNGNQLRFCRHNRT
jgi:hypothetical protein